MSETLKAFSVWFGMTMIDPKKCFGLRESKVPFVA